MSRLSNNEPHFTFSAQDGQTVEGFVETSVDVMINSVKRRADKFELFLVAAPSEKEATRLTEAFRTKLSKAGLKDFDASQGSMEGIPTVFCCVTVK